MQVARIVGARGACASGAPCGQLGSDHCRRAPRSPHRHSSVLLVALRPIRAAPARARTISDTETLRPQLLPAKTPRRKLLALVTKPARTAGFGFGRLLVAGRRYRRGGVSAKSRPRRLRQMQEAELVPHATAVQLYLPCNCSPLASLHTTALQKQHQDGSAHLFLHRAGASGPPSGWA